jgi:hypothetical protein
MRHIKYARDVGALVGGQRFARGGIGVFSPVMSRLPDHSTAGELGHVVGQGDREVVVRPGIVRKRAFCAESVKMGKISGSQRRDRVGPEAVDADVNDTSGRLVSSLLFLSKPLTDHEPDVKKRCR